VQKAAGYVASYQIYPVHVLYADSLIDFLALALATNISLAALMVGRILYSRRNLRTLGQTTFIRRRDQGAVSTFFCTPYHLLSDRMDTRLESAVLYLLCLCAEMVLLALSTSTGSNTVFAIGLQLMVRNQFSKRSSC
jgi:hypothetical protein